MGDSLKAASIVYTLNELWGAWFSNLAWLFLIDLKTGWLRNKSSTLSQHIYINLLNFKYNLKDDKTALHQCWSFWTLYFSTKTTCGTGKYWNMYLLTKHRRNELDALGLFGEISDRWNIVLRVRASYLRLVQ